MPTTEDSERLSRGFALLVTRPRVAVGDCRHHVAIHEAEVVSRGLCPPCSTAPST
ncbi:hypothetical protein LWC33_04690 [Pseudonocardia sp. RS11V-5]|uniref:hypothetical protein n=1 Tax=Pseudonocardia terrae TaxID=2905831 RepID=UPI001E51AF4B|nr:hypothetical protein [Pseudonocardia terrae]MCE3550751.1 hypothetical protein [Pseudonocardia terrae]